MTINKNMTKKKKKKKLETSKLKTEARRIITKYKYTAPVCFAKHAY